MFSEPAERNGIVKHAASRKIILKCKSIPNSCTRTVSDLASCIGLHNSLEYLQSMLAIYQPCVAVDPQSRSAGSGIQLPLLQVEVVTGESPPQWKVICDPSTVLELLPSMWPLTGAVGGPHWDTEREVIIFIAGMKDQHQTMYLRSHLNT